MIHSPSFDSEPQNKIATILYIWNKNWNMKEKKKKKTCQLATEFQLLFSFIEVNARRVFFVVVSFFIYSYHSSVSDGLSWTHHNFRGQIFIICRQPAGPPSWRTLSIWLYVQTINFYRKTQLTKQNIL